MTGRNWYLKTLMVAMMALLALSACTTPQMAGSPATGNQIGNEAGPNTTGGQTAPTTGDQPGGLITSSGTQVPGQASAGSSGGQVQADSSGGSSGAPDATAGGNLGDALSHFQLYRSELCHFQIGYPNGSPADYVPQEGAVTNQGEATVCRVAFQDRVLAQSDTAALQPPLFLIEVFDRGSNAQALEEWVRAQPLPGKSSAATEPTTLSGVTGLKVTLMQEMAPNQFFFVARDNYIYKLTPLGLYGNAMLATFRFTD
ncbi:MAG: hypothetical protein WAV79_14000 [Anaerolineae bacterium]